MKRLLVVLIITCTFLHLTAQQKQGTAPAPNAAAKEEKTETPNLPNLVIGIPPLIMKQR